MSKNYRKKTDGTGIGLESEITQNMKLTLMHKKTSLIKKEDVSHHIRTNLRNIVYIGAVTRLTIFFINLHTYSSP